jgi:hypothetical protein
VTGCGVPVIARDYLLEALISADRILWPGTLGPVGGLICDLWMLVLLR